MSGLIDADALEREGWSLCRTFQKDKDTMVYEVKKPSDFPTIEERKIGRWLPDNRPGGGFWVCSECKFPSEAFTANVLYKFCPNCGADMRGEQNE